MSSNLLQHKKNDEMCNKNTRTHTQTNRANKNEHPNFKQVLKVRLKRYNACGIEHIFLLLLNLNLHRADRDKTKQQQQQRTKKEKCH